MNIHPNAGSEDGDFILDDVFPFTPLLAVALTLRTPIKSATALDDPLTAKWSEAALPSHHHGGCSSFIRAQALVMVHHFPPPLRLLYNDNISILDVHPLSSSPNTQPESVKQKPVK